MPQYAMRDLIRIVEHGLMEGKHSGWPDEEEAEEFSLSKLGPTGTFEAYHASLNKFTRFRPYTHFGTKQAALERARDLAMNKRGGFLYEVILPVSKSVWTEDSGTGRHPVAGIMENLETILNLDFSAVSEASRSATKAAALLRRYGYDAIVYRNGHEDKGSLSWIALAPSKITIRSVSPIRAEDIELL